MSDRPERPTADMRPDPTDPAHPLPPLDAREPAGPPTGEPVAVITHSHETAASAPLGESAEAAARDEPALTEPAATTPFEEPPPAAAPARRRDYRGLALGLAATLLLVLAVVGTAPFWAPLLPWGDEGSGTDPAIVERLDADQQQ